MTTSATIDKVLESFSTVFVNALKTSMTEAIGSTWAVSSVPREDATSDESEPVRIGLTLEGNLNGEFLLEIPRTDAAMLGTKFVPGAPDEFGAEHSEALLKCVEGAAAGFRTALAQKYGPITIQTSLAVEPSSNLTSAFHADVTDDSSNRASLSIFLNPKLIESLTLHSNLESTIGEARKAMTSAADQAIQETTNLNLVMDVELNVTLRFGQRQLTLREVLDLTSGSVIELDRQVEEPVELLLEGKVIARGEAVVIDGNYGLRVTEVSQVFSSRSSIQRAARFASTENLEEESK
jgi:flagellar motor switch protein FliN/FliY